MLKIYDKLEDVPEALREHYKLVNGKAVPDLSDDHPVLVNNRTLLNEKTAAETKVSGLETQVATLKTDVESARSSGLPRGHKAVPNADAEFLEKVKLHGTADEIAVKIGEHKTLKEESETRKQQDHLRVIAKELDYDADAFLLLPKLVTQFPEMEIREADGKKTVIAKVKDQAGTITEKPAVDYIGSMPEFGKVALKVSGTGTRVPDQRNPSPTGGGGDDLITQRNKQREEARKTSPNPLMAKTAAPGAQAAQ